MNRRNLLLLLSMVTGGAAISILYFLLRQHDRVVGQAGLEKDYVVETVKEGLIIPWEIDFISGDEALITERPGRVVLLTLSTGRSQVLGEIDVEHVGEGGLLGLTHIEPGSRPITYYTYRDGTLLYNRVQLWDSLEFKEGVVLLDRIPAAPVHDGGRVKTGPDARLYITTGDAANPESAQDLNSTAGKILRIGIDGSIPSDNPFKDSPIYSYGHRNPQGISWRRGGEQLFATEHGPSGEMGLVANDEVNRIVPGGNYGWPRVVGKQEVEGFMEPIYHSGSETWAPSGCTFYYGSDFPQWNDNLFFAALRGEHLHRLAVSEDGTRVVESEKLLYREYGRLRNVVQGPDGLLYVLTSNRDGRGSVRPGDDKLLRLSPRR
ncbi:Aldose sugar dehydrogenase YliI [Candidatus Calditenuaceae archaeon HR02]|nr:Aldose sugar dehydrogenase YliI [Candidatus Calditenuaceae archaeon HR02]